MVKVTAEVSGWLIGIVVAIAGLFLFWQLFDINFTSPHQHYKRKLGEAYLVQPDATDPGADLRKNVPLLLSKCAEKARAPYT